MSRPTEAGDGRQSTAVPVLQVEGSPPADRPKTALVVGFDQTAASLAALGKAAEIGAQLQARLHVIHAVDLADYPVDPDADDWEEQAAKSLEEERQRVSAALAEYPCGWSFVALRADPAEALNRTAEEVDAVMIVVGVRSHGWRHIFERLAGPSVSHRLINHCHRPVLVVSYDQAS